MARQLLEIYIENSTIYELAGSVESALFAEKLFISVATVKTHIQNMKNRTGFRNRTELAVKSRESGLIICGQKMESN